MAQHFVRKDIFLCKHTCVPRRPGRSNGSWLILVSSLWCRSLCGSQCSWARSQNPPWWRKSQCLGSGSRHAASPNPVAGGPGSWFQAPGGNENCGGKKKIYEFEQIDFRSIGVEWRRRHLVDDLWHLVTVVRRIIADPQFSLPTYVQEERLEKRQAAVRPLGIMSSLILFGP